MYTEVSRHIQPPSSVSKSKLSKKSTRNKYQAQQILVYTSNLKMKTVYFSVTSMNFYRLHGVVSQI